LAIVADSFSVNSGVERFVKKELPLLIKTICIATRHCGECHLVSYDIRMGYLWFFLWVFADRPVLILASRDKRVPCLFLANTD
jgi:hypothetical protein